MIKAFFLVAGVALYVLVGHKACMGAYSDFNSLKNLQEENQLLESQVEQARVERENTIQELRGLGTEVFGSNTEIAQCIASLPSATVLEIAAEQCTNGVFIPVVSTERVTDVEFFTEDIQYMLFTLGASDVSAAVEALNGTGIRVHSISVDYSSGKVWVRVPTLFTSQEGGSND